MDNTPIPRVIPDLLQQVLVQVLTLAAALLYLGILGYAIVKGFMGSDLAFTEGAMRAAQLLSGLVGSVVTAGFARARLPTGAVNIPREINGRPAAGQRRPLSSSRTRLKFVGLGEAIGFRVQASLPDRSPAGEGEEPGPQPAPQVSPLSLWVGLIYFGVYFLVGMGAFALILIRSEVPEFLTNSAWVWLGTLIAAGYSFFSLSGSGAEQ
jgi:hypothetical protein